MMEERGGEPPEMETHQRLTTILEAVNRVTRNLQLSHDSPDSDSSAIKALLKLQAASVSVLSSHPHLLSLSQSLSKLADSVQDLHNSKPSTHGIISFMTRRVKHHEVSRLASEIDSELNALIDRENVSNLTRTLSAMRRSSSEGLNEHQLFDQISALQQRLSRGFNISLQDLLLKSGIFAELEWILCNPLLTRSVREKAAISMKELVLFNKDVFVGSILIGGSVKALVSMDSLCSLQVLTALIKAIKSPLVDVIESYGGISKIVGHLSSENVEMRVAAKECVMEIGYFGRKEAVETMINGGLIQKLVELQSSAMEENHKNPFSKCVAGFAVQLEVGEGLRQREKRAFKQIILSRVRERGTCVSDHQCATIVAEVLWGSSP